MILFCCRDHVLVAACDSFDLKIHVHFLFCRSLSTGQMLAFSMDRLIAFSGDGKPTSYDYDGLLTEAGDVTPKYWAVRNFTSTVFFCPSCTT